MNFLTNIDFSASKSVIVACAVLALASIDIVRRINHRTTHVLFATILGSALSLGLIRTVDLFLRPGSEDNPYAMAFLIVLTALGWKSLFGSWDVQTKTVMLGTFLFWVCIRMFAGDEPRDQLVRLIAAGTALIPAAIWCRLFLKYHRERMSHVLLLFFAGMLSTVPILFYDTLVRRGVEMQFFLFSIQPQSFSKVAHSFVSGQLTGSSAAQTLVFGTLLSFIFVGMIEEVSKGWVLSKSGKNIFTSIDDVMQLSIVVAIGFAFAENIINPTYFTAFVRNNLFQADVNVVGFIGNVLGRSVLTSMVHILSTGVLGYFLGLAIFAGPYLREQKESSLLHKAIHAVHRLLRLKEVSIFRVQMLTIGLLAAIGLHGLFNFLVTLPEILPGNPQSIGDVFGFESGSILTNIPFLLLPALFYVVGGFWLLTFLFMRTSNMKEHGHLVLKEEYVASLPENS